MNEHLPPGERRLEGMSAATWRAAVGSRQLRSAMTGVFLLDRSPDPRALTKPMEQTTRLFPALRSRIIESASPAGQPRLVVDPEFDLDLHVAHYVMPAPGSWEQVLQHARRSSLVDLDRDRALWRAALFDGLHGGRSAVILVVHHAIADGQGLVKIAHSLLDASAEATTDLAMPAPPAAGRVDRQLPTLDARRGTARPGPSLAARAARSWPRAARGLAANPVRASGGALKLAGSARRVGRVHSAPLSSLMSGRGSTYSLRTLDLSFPSLRAAAREHGSTLNDAFLAGLTAGIRRYHESRGAAAGPIRVNVPVSFRTAESRADDNTHAIARIVLDASEPDSATRFAEVRRVMANAVDEPFLPHIDLVAEASRLLPVEAIVAMSRGSDLTASNVPGVPVPVWLGGAQVERIYPVVGTLGAAANVTLLSYAGRWCSIGVAADDVAIDRPGLFVECLAEGYAELGVELAPDPYDPL